MQKQMTFLGEIVNIPEKKNNWKNDLERKKLFEDPFYREKRSKQNKPYNYDIEITEGCDLFCDHCAIRTQWNGERRFNFMTIELAEQLSKAIGFFTPKVRVVFAMHGEPTTNKDFVEITKLFRKNIPLAQLSLVTNGVVIRNKGESYLKNLFNAGINIIYLSSYNGEKDNFSLPEVEIIDFYNCDKKVYAKYNIHYYHKPNIKWILKVEDIKNNTGKRRVRTMFNVGGNVDFSLMKKYGVYPLKEPLKKMCVHPFHDMTIDYDGTVVSCCQDWKQKQMMGKFPEESLSDIWFGKKFTSLRTVLRNKRRDLAPLCSKCDYVGGLMLALVPHCFGDVNEAGKILSAL